MSGLQCSGVWLYLLAAGPPLLKFALLLGSSVFKSSTHRTQFNLHLFSQSFIHGIRGMIIKVVVNNK